MSGSAPPASVRGETYRHEALLYTGLDGFLDGVVPFVRDGVAAGEPVLVVVSAEKIALLREAVGGDAGAVLFAEMDEVGGNPARIIPAWRAFVSEHWGPGRRVRGVGEPIHPGRTPAEIDECHRHEALLNLAFGDTPGFWLLCPYDVGALDPDVIHAAERNHPFVRDGRAERASGAYAGEEAIAAPFDDPLPRPARAFDALAFDAGNIRALRRFVADHAREAGLSGERVRDLVLAVSEMASNSIEYGGGAGVLRLWDGGDTLVCEIRDRGAIVEPLAGRVAPEAAQLTGRGLWIANQLCDLVQVRAFEGGGVVRLHMRLPAS